MTAADRASRLAQIRERAEKAAPLIRDHTAFIADIVATCFDATPAEHEDSECWKGADALTRADIPWLLEEIERLQQARPKCDACLSEGVPDSYFCVYGDRKANRAAADAVLARACVKMPVHEVGCSGNHRVLADGCVECETSRAEPTREQIIDAIQSVYGQAVGRDDTAASKAADAVLALFRAEAKPVVCDTGFCSGGFHIRDCPGHPPGCRFASPELS